MAKMKKVLAIAMAAAMGMSMLAGCAVTDAVKEKAAEKGLEVAARAYTGKDVEFTQVNKAEYKDAMKD